MVMTMMMILYDGDDGGDHSRIDGGEDEQS